MTPTGRSASHHTTHSPAAPHKDQSSAPADDRWTEPRQLHLNQHATEEMPSILRCAGNACELCLSLRARAWGRRKAASESGPHLPPPSCRTASLHPSGVAPSRTTHGMTFSATPRSPVRRAMRTRALPPDSDRVVRLAAGAIAEECARGWRAPTLAPTSIALPLYWEHSSAISIEYW